MKIISNCKRFILKQIKEVDRNIARLNYHKHKFDEEIWQDSMLELKLQKKQLKEKLAVL